MRFLRSTESDLFQRIFDICKRDHLNTNFLEAACSTFEGTDSRIYHFPAIVINYNEVDRHEFRLWYRANEERKFLTLTPAEAIEIANGWIWDYNTWAGTRL